MYFRYIVCYIINLLSLTTVPAGGGLINPAVRTCYHLFRLYHRLVLTLLTLPHALHFCALVSVFVGVPPACVSLLCCHIHLIPSFVETPVQLLFLYVDVAVRARFCGAPPSLRLPLARVIFTPPCVFQVTLFSVFNTGSLSWRCGTLFKAS